MIKIFFLRSEHAFVFFYLVMEVGYFFAPMLDSFKIWIRSYKFHPNLFLVGMDLLLKADNFHLHVLPACHRVNNLECIGLMACLV
jgi:hypothetical protein